jgi:LuxR family maltose regulon positive regulatory protein
MTRAPGGVVVTQTKIRLPAPPSSVARPRLDDHATAILAYPITIVSAGAGFGKTTILHAWAKRCSEFADVAWLGLDEGDASVHAFASYLDASLRRALPALGPSVPAMLAEGTVEPATLARALVNELFNVVEDATRDTVVFLDDFHTVQGEQSIRDLVGELLRMLPPRVHLVIATRFPCDFSPLVKMRADRRVADFDRNDLRFRGDEILALLADAGISKPDTITLESLLRRTDGWAMALRLSTQAPADVRGDERPLADVSQRSLFAYLAEEVLRSQTPELRDQLLICSVLKHMDPAAVTRLLETNGEAVLERFFARNLYLEPAGDRTYRFHHLFREFLLQTFERESPERVRTIRLRYAKLLEERGDAVAAVSQYVQAGEFFAAADQIVPAFRLVKWGDDFERISKVLEDLPEEFLRARPDVLRLRGLAKRRNFDAPSAIALIERALDYATAIGDTATEALSCIDLALLYDNFANAAYGRFDRNVAMVRRAISVAPPNDVGAGIRRSGLAILGLCHAAMDEFDKAIECLDRVVELELESDARRTDGYNSAAYIYALVGRWQKSLELAELSEERVRDEGPMFLGRALRLQAQAKTHMREDLARALVCARGAIEADRAANQWDNILESYIVLARTYLAQDVPDIEHAHAALDEAQRGLMRRPSPTAEFDARYVRFETYVLSGDLERARRGIDDLERAYEKSGDPHQAASISFARGLCALTGDDLSSAFEQFEIARDRFAPTGDRFRLALAATAAAGISARLGRMTPTAFVDLVDLIERGGQRYVAAWAPKSAAALLVWSLRNRCDVTRATAVFGRGAQLGGAEALIDLASDPRADVEARVAAIGLLARVGERHRDALQKLAAAPSPAIAAAATTSLGLMPQTVAPLSVWIVGGVTVHVGNDRFSERDGRWPRRKAIDLLRALATAEGPILKSTVVRYLWPESSASSAESSFRVTLHALRRALQPNVDGAGDYVEYDGTTLRLRPHTLAFVDARTALTDFRQASFERSRNRPDDAHRLYTNVVDLLASSPNPDEVPAWLEPLVRTWRETLLAALRALAEIERAAGAHAAARAYVTRALALDPLDESSVAEALEIALADSDPERSRELFSAYKARLSSELGLTPSRDLLERYGRVMEARSLRRGHGLTPRDLQLLSLVSRGKSSKQIAAELGVSAYTINAQMSRILRKLQVDSRAAAVAAVSGLLDA